MYNTNAVKDADDKVGINKYMVKASNGHVVGK